MLEKIKFEDDFSDAQFLQYLYQQIINQTLKEGRAGETPVGILFSGAHDRIAQLTDRLGNKKYRFFYDVTEALESTEPIDLIVCTETCNKDINDFFRLIRQYEKFKAAAFIYKLRGSETYPALNDFDQWREFGIAGTHVYASGRFDDGMFEAIYRYSLTRVNRKCQVRDAYDLYQCLVNTAGLCGDIVEFGSYEGHSGLIMAEFIKRRNIVKRLYLFDMFEEFPAENLGIDKRWNDSHFVDFQQVKDRFTDYPFVELVKGDLTETVHTVPLEKISLAFIDCDSARATEYIAHYIYPKLENGGIIIFEDYGHHDLLGARMVIDDFIELKKDEIVSFFSFFSGLMMVVKK